jgi:hypothetical protein
LARVAVGIRGYCCDGVRPRREHELLCPQAACADRHRSPVQGQRSDPRGVTRRTETVS